jgi:hypothetical protein
MLLPWAHPQAHVLLHVLHATQQRHLSQALQHLLLVPAVTSAAAWPLGVQ